MNHREFIRAMSEIGYSGKGAERLVRLSKDSSDLVLRTFNFVPRGDGLYEIWLSDERDYFHRVRKGASDFFGTLSDAYEWVVEDRSK